MFISRLLLACLMMSMVLWFFSPPIEYWVAQEAIKRVSMLAALVMGAGFVYVLTLWMFGLRLKHVLTETVPLK